MWPMRPSPIFSFKPRPPGRAGAKSVTNPYSLTVARVRGISCNWSRAAEALSRGGFSFARTAAFHMPRFALAPAAAVLAVLQLVFTPGRARAYFENLEYILPEGRASSRARAVLTFKALRSYGLFLLEFLKISKMERGRFMRGFCFEGLAEMDRALDAGNGVILVATHIGNWEAGARALACAGYKIHIVVGVQLNPKLSPFMKAIKNDLGIGVVSPGPGEYRRLIEALRANEIVVLAVDGDTFAKGLHVPFFRGRTRTAAGPARLAALTGASVVGTHVIRERSMHFKMNFRTLWDGPGGATSREDVLGLHPQDAGFVPNLTERLMRDLQEPIAAHLDQWCIFRPLWRGMKRRDPLTAGPTEDGDIEPSGGALRTHPGAS